MENFDTSDFAIESTEMDASTSMATDLNASSSTESSMQSNTFDSIANTSQQYGSGSSDTATGNQAMLDKYKYVENYNFPYLDDSRKYEKVKKIGHGTFGEVFKAREKRSNKKFVAMKKVLIDNKEKEEGVRI